MTGRYWEYHVEIELGTKDRCGPVPPGGPGAGSRGPGWDMVSARWGTVSRPGGHRDDRAGRGGFSPGTWRDYGGFVAGLVGATADRSRPVDRVRDPAGPGGTWRRPGGDRVAAGRTPGRPGGTWRV